jgi:hypothetical protein
MSATIIRLPAAAGPLNSTVVRETEIREWNDRKAVARSHREKLLAEATERATASSGPIFAAIKVHLAAVVTKINHTDETSGMTFEEEEADESYSDRLAELCDLALETVLDTSPTTWEGVAALLEHVARHEFLDPGRRRSGHETFLSSCNECSGESKRFGQEFPLRLAKAVRGLKRSAVDEAGSPR